MDITQMDWHETSQTDSPPSNQAKLTVTVSENGEIMLQSSDNSSIKTTYQSIDEACEGFGEFLGQGKAALTTG